MRKIQKKRRMSRRVISHSAAHDTGQRIENQQKYKSIYKAPLPLICILMTECRLCCACTIGGGGLLEPCVASDKSFRLRSLFKQEPLEWHQKRFSFSWTCLALGDGALAAWRKSRSVAEWVSELGVLVLYLYFYFHWSCVDVQKFLFYTTLSLQSYIARNGTFLAIL